jgi:hypothetical protein
LTCASAPRGASGLHRCRFSKVESEWICFQDRGPSVNANVRAKIEKLATEKHERVMLERLLNELSKIAFGRELLDLRLDLNISHHVDLREMPGEGRCMRYGANGS